MLNMKTQISKYPKEEMTALEEVKYRKERGGNMFKVALGFIDPQNARRIVTFKVKDREQAELMTGVLNALSTSK